MTTITLLVKAPPLPIIPEERHGRLVLMILAVHVGDLEAGQRTVEPLRALGPGLVDLTGPMPYHAIFDFTREATVSSHHIGRTLFLKDLPDALVDTLIQHVEHGTSPLSFAQIRPLGGAFARVPKDATAFAHRDQNYMLSLINDWDGPDAADAAVHHDWLRDFWQAVRPFGSGCMSISWRPKNGTASARRIQAPPTTAWLP